MPKKKAAAHSIQMCQAISGLFRESEWLTLWKPQGDGMTKTRLLNWISGNRNGLFSILTVRRNKRIMLIDMNGGGRKRACSVVNIYEDLREEFERLCSLGLKFKTYMLLAPTRKLIAKADVSCSYHSYILKNGNLFDYHLFITWM